MPLPTSQQPTDVGAYRPPTDAPPTLEETTRELVEAASVGARLWRNPWIRRGASALAGAVLALSPTVFRVVKTGALHENIDSTQQVQIDSGRAMRLRLDARLGDVERAVATWRAEDSAAHAKLARGVCVLMQQEQRDLWGCSLAGASTAAAMPLSGAPGYQSRAASASSALRALSSIPP